LHELDRAAVERLREAVGDAEFQLIGRDFVDDCERLERELRAALAEGDGSAVRALAHELRGLAATFGAVALARSCRAVEQAGDTAQSAVAATIRACSSARNAMLRSITDAGRGAA
jgi:HPt (histidine-containing phosphotransfer) domain-containing protein